MRRAEALAGDHSVTHSARTFVDASRVSCRGTPCTPRTLVTEVTAPTDVANGPFPVVVFAHGFAVDPGYYQLLLDRIARAGFVVVAPRLPESAASGSGPPIRLYTEPQARDLSFVLNEITDLVINHTDDWNELADVRRPTIVGHSDGAIIAGAVLSSTFRDPRFVGGTLVAGEADPATSPSLSPSPYVFTLQGGLDTIAPLSGSLYQYHHAAAPKARTLDADRSHDGVILDATAGPARDAVVGWLDWIGRTDVSGLGRWADYALDDPGNDTQTTGLDLSPIGVIESATAGFDSDSGGQVTVSGWAFDPDRTSPINVAIRLGADASNPVFTIGAGNERPDVGAVWGNGSLHGFFAVLTIPAGVTHVCAVAQNVGKGTDRDIGCRSVVRPPPAAVASVEVRPFHQSIAAQWAARPTNELVSSYEATCSCGATKTVSAGGSPSTAFAGLPNGSPVTITVRPRNAFGLGPPTVSSSATPVDRPAGFVPVVPTRVFDTRSANAPILGPVTSRVVDLPDPPVNAVGVVLAVTAIDPSVNSFLTVSPAGAGAGDVSSLNIQPGVGPMSNQVVVPLGINGDVEVFNNSGVVHAAVDLMGWLVADTGARRSPINPSRVLDTRYPPGEPIGAGATRTVHVTNDASVIAAGIVVTSTNASTRSFLAAWGAGNRPLTSISNPEPGLNRAANVIVPVDANGDVHLYNNSGTVDLVIDVTGFFVAGSGTDTQQWHGQAPWRLYDSRTSDGPFTPELVRVLASPYTWQANVVATETASYGHVTAWGDGPWPGTSNLNYVPGLTVAQQVTAGSSVHGLKLLTSGNAQLIVDISGEWR